MASLSHTHSLTHTLSHTLSHLSLSHLSRSLSLISHLSFLISLSSFSVSHFCLTLTLSSLSLYLSISSPPPFHLYLSLISIPLQSQPSLSCSLCVFVSSWLRLDLVVVASSLVALSPAGLPQGIVMVYMHAYILICTQE